MKNVIRFLLVAFCLSTTLNLLHAQWIQMNEPNFMVIDLVTSGPNLIAGAFNGIYVSSNGGANWSRANVFGADSALTAIGVSSNGVGGTNVFAATYGPRVFRSTDNGVSWSVAGILPASWVNNLVGFGTSVYAATTQGLYRSTDNGATWKPILGQDNYVWRIAVSSNGKGGTNLFVARPFRFSTDDGATWTYLSSGSSSVTALFISGTTVLAGLSGDGVIRSTDNGTTWSKANTTSGNVVLPSVDKIVEYGTRMFASFSQYGIWMSVDSGASWAPINTGLPSVTVNTLVIYGTDLYTQAGAVLCRRPLSELTTQIKRFEGDLPTHLVLDQNYPNPFNPTTTISFYLPSRSMVSLKIFDALGREVAALVAEELAAGTYSRLWNAAGSPSGVYFYRLVANATPPGQAGSFIETKKLVVLK